LWQYIEIVLKVSKNNSQYHSTTAHT